MPQSLVAFVLSLLHAVFPALFIVMSTAFITIPQAFGSHPGETRVMASTDGMYHPS